MAQVTVDLDDVAQAEINKLKRENKQLRGKLAKVEMQLQIARNNLKNLDNASRAIRECWAELDGLNIGY